MRVLVVSSDHVGATMAGPGIRSYNFSRELAKRFDVTLSVPYETDVEVDDVEVRVVDPYDARAMTPLTTSFDAVVAQRLPVSTLRALARSGTRTVYDLYAPYQIENLALASERSAGKADRASLRLTALVQEAVLRYGDAFICASESQRDLWLGSLLALGRIDHQLYEHDRTVRGLIDIVPFGIEPDPPQPGPAMRGVVPGIDESSRILLWPGGIWNWFDPLTVIRAVDELRRAGRDELWLVFLGIAHPNPRVPAMRMTRRALDLAAELGLTGNGVHFNDSWVPYGERGAWLLESDLGVSAHFDDLEARFAYRTRLLDCFWAGLPVATTDGDALARLVDTRELGRVVPPEDVGGWTRTIASLLDNDDARRRARASIEEVRDELTWPRVVEPLVRLLEEPTHTSGHVVDTTLAVYGARRLDYALASRGIGGTARRLTEIVAGTIAPGRSVPSGGKRDADE